MKSVNVVRWIIPSLLLTFYSYVAYLSLNPEVTDLYRSYYMDKRLEQWPKPLFSQREKMNK